MEKEMATYSSILAWKSPWTEELGRLQSMGLHDWARMHEGGGRWVGSNKLVEPKNIKDSTKNVLDLLSGPMVKIPCFHCRGVSLIPGQPKDKKKKIKKMFLKSCQNVLQVKEKQEKKVKRE